MSVNGGPAFPQPLALNDVNEIVSPMESDEGGMTLRDWFAGMAMTGLCGRPIAAFAPTQDETLAQCVARNAYGYADAMLAERERQRGSDGEATPH